MAVIAASALEVASCTVSQLGESPRWDAARGSLWWVDITGGRLHERRFDGTTASVALDRPAGAVNPADDGRLLLATTAGLEVFDVVTRQAVVRVPIERDLPDRRMNDAAVDARGRVFAGTMRWDAGDPPHDGVLYRIDPDGSTEPVLSGLGCPNGIAWPAPHTMAFIDSMSRSIALWAVDPGTGVLGEKVGVIDVSGFEGVPDGMTLDAEGGLWVAFWNGGAVRRLALDGTVLTTVEVPTPLVTAVAFGGRDLDVLFITTAVGPDESRDAAAGLLYRCVPGERGVLPSLWPAASVA